MNNSFTKKGLSYFPMGKIHHHECYFDVQTLWIFLLRGAYVTFVLWVLPSSLAHGESNLYYAHPASFGVLSFQILNHLSKKRSLEEKIREFKSIDYY